jgi:cytochrome b
MEAPGFVVAWLSADDPRWLHLWSGYSALALVILRIVWGFLGPREARFVSFVRGPAATLAYLGASMRGREERYLGHNPAGGAMVVALLLGLLALCITGWMYTTDRFWGVDWVEDTHEALSNVLVALVLLHIGGVLLSSYRHRENLAGAMVTGNKRAEVSSAGTAETGVVKSSSGH